MSASRGGGRLALTRLASALGNINMGHFIPDYTAYEELLSVFKAFTPIPILLRAEHGYKISPGDLKEEILGRGLSALLVSNPANPTGQLMAGKELAAWCQLARECQCSMIFDEFYSHYIYTNGKRKSPRWFPPLNLSRTWTKTRCRRGRPHEELALSRLAHQLDARPEAVIEAIASAGSFLDGGANHPFQNAALPLLDPKNAEAETLAIQKHFGRKRELLLARLKKLKIGVDATPAGAFYVWANLAKLPAPLDDGMNFFANASRKRPSWCRAFFLT